MKNTKIFRLILILIMGSVIAAPALISHLHAAGLPSLFLSPASRLLAPSNTLVNFNVSVSNMPAFAGWDIIVKADSHFALNPMSINIVDTFGGTFTELTQCINGSGLGCSLNDQAGVAHSAGYSVGSTDSGNVTLFKVTFNSTATSGFTFLSLPSPLLTDSTGSDITPASGNIFGATYGNAANAPVAEFSWSPLVPVVGASVNLNASLSSDPNPGTVITSYKWGGTSTTSPIFTVIFGTPGNHTVTLTVTDSKGLASAPTSHVIHVIQAIPNFSMFAYPSSLSIPQGSSGTSLIALSGVGNFSGTVNLSSSVIPPGPTTLLNVSSLHLNVGGLNSTLLTVRAAPTVATGLYTVTVTGTNGALSHSTTLNINVGTKIASSLAIDGSAIRGCDHSTNSCSTPFSTQHSNDIVIVYTLEQLDLQTSCTFNVTDTAGLSWAARSSVVFGNGGRDQIQEFWAKTASALSLDTITESISGCASFQFGGEYNGLFVFGITGANFNTPFDPNTPLPGTASGNGGGTSLAVSTSNANDMIIGAVLHGTSAIPTAGTGFTLINATGTVAAEYENVNTVVTNSTVTFGDSLAASWESIGDAVQQSGTGKPDFFLTPNPRFLALTAGSSGSSSITVASANGFSGTITLSATSPSGLTGTLNPTTVNLSPNGSASSTFTIGSTSSTPPGTYPVTVTATIGTLTRSTVVTVTVTSPDFTISVSPISQAVPPGGNTTFTISLASLNGFSGAVTFTSAISPAVSNPPTTTLTPASVVLVPNSFATVVLSVGTQLLTPSQFYTIALTGFSPGRVHTVTMSLQVLPPPDEPPVASFTFTPSNPTVGQIVNFDGSFSVDPDGAVNSWTWSFGDGGFVGFGEFTSHAYFSPGNYSVTLTVFDISGRSSFRTAIISVRPQPLHDVAIEQISVQVTKVVSTQTVPIQLELANSGSNNETVSVTAYANGRPVQTLRGIFLQACRPSPFCFSGFYLQILWDTSGVSPGNYTISATVSLPAGEVDPTPSDNIATDGIVAVLPAPVIVISPNTGIDGTKVLVQGSGFPAQQQFGYLPSTFIYVNFDNMSLGFTFSHNGTFTFTFDVPLSQPGAHAVFAYDPYSGAHASATFTVQSTPTGTLVVSINMGTIYFPGDTAVTYVLTTFNGAPVGPQNVQLQLVLFRPDGTNITLTATPIGHGLYKATYTVPSTGSMLGTYLVLAKAHQPGPIDSTALASFEVKPTWISSNSGKITVGATTLAGVIGIGAVAWKKGYFRRRENAETEPISF